MAQKQDGSNDDAPLHDALLEAALATLRLEESLCRQRGDDHELAKVLANQGSYLLLTGKSGAAAAKYSEAVRVCRTTNDRAILQTLLCSLGDALLQSHRLNEAETAFAEAETLCRQCGNHEWLDYAAGRRAEIRRALHSGQ